MKTLHKITLLVMMIFSLFSLTACTEDNSLDVSTYCYTTVAYKVNGSDTSLGLDLSEITSDTCPYNSYSVMQITTNRSWTYGLNLQKVSFDILLNESANVDIDITISNLENGDHYNSTQDTYFFTKTLSINKENTSISLDISDTFINKDAVISIEVVNSCYVDHPNLKLSVQNFKLFGEHKPTTY